MPTHSAGLLPYSLLSTGLRVFVGHMGGPFWARKDEGAWTIIKGVYLPDCEPALDAAQREFREEIGVEPPPGEVTSLGDLRASRKIITVYAVVADPSSLAFAASNMMTMEWPPRSGRTVEFPEIDRAEWMTVDEARRLLVRGQLPFLDRLAELCPAEPPPEV